MVREKNLPNATSSIWAFFLFSFSADPTKNGEEGDEGGEA